MVFGVFFKGFGVFLRGFEWFFKPKRAYIAHMGYSLYTHGGWFIGLPFAIPSVIPLVATFILPYAIPEVIPLVAASI